MANRRKLLDTSKDKAKSLAGTIGSLAGTVADKGKQAARTSKEKGKKATKRGKQAGKKAKGAARAAKEKGEQANAVVQEFRELVDDNVTREDRQRIQAARQETQREAKQNPDQNPQQLFRQNLFEQAVAAERQEQRQEQAETQRQPQRGGMAMFGVPTRQRPAQQPAGRAESGEQFEPVNTMVFGGFAPRQNGQAQQAPNKTESMFGVGPQGTDQTEQVAPLFGLRY